MNRKLIGYSVSSFGFGVLTSSVIYPLGFLESALVYSVMTSVGAVLMIIGSFIRPSKKE